MGQYENLIFEDVLTIKKSMSKISFEYALRVGVGQGSLACCRLWGHKESDTAEWLNWTELNWMTLLVLCHIDAAYMLGASMGDPTYDKGQEEEPWWPKAGQVLRDSLTPPMTRSCGQGRSRLKKSPRSARESIPETKICLLYYTLLTLTGAIPDHLSLEN